ncbi:hypothetical protein Sjap_013254 [Stephania japonica]|uniref:Uncharacterized protein n=1 Tax=Stephania japonica TaxID=461633 RepID=A0AAP0NXH5_9MAGN
MVDQRDPSDDSGTSSTRAVSIEEFQTLTQRVAAQERQLEEILPILRASIVVASVPSTARVTVTQEANTPRVTTMTLLPTTTAMRPVMAVVPHAPIEIAPATLTVIQIGLSNETVLDVLNFDMKIYFRLIKSVLAVIGIEMRAGTRIELHGPVWPPVKRSKGQLTLVNRSRVKRPLTSQLVRGEVHLPPIDCRGGEHKLPSSTPTTTTLRRFHATEGISAAGRGGRRLSAAAVEERAVWPPVNSVKGSIDHGQPVQGQPTLDRSTRLGGKFIFPPSTAVEGSTSSPPRPRPPPPSVASTRRRGISGGWPGGRRLSAAAVEERVCTRPWWRKTKSRGNGVLIPEWRNSENRYRFS